MQEGMLKVAPAMFLCVKHKCTFIFINFLHFMGQFIETSYAMFFESFTINTAVETNNSIHSLQWKIL